VLGTDLYVLDLNDVGEAQISDVGGKAASLGELSRIDGIHVPAGFCVTTAAFRAADAGQIPDHIASAIVEAIETLGGDEPYAVRSSALAEDSPSASFAGQHDSYLNIRGVDSILEHVQKCWESLFTDRAIVYRAQSNLGEHELAMAVIVQRMVDATAAGVLFTADPLSGNRTIVAIDAVPGLADTLVSGAENPDSYRVRGAQIIERATQTSQPVLGNDQILELAKLGRNIEQHFGSPQDIEWCLSHEGFTIVQARPITTLFPIPEARPGVEGNRVYVSVGHGQMMTDAIKLLGLSVWLHTTPAPMTTAGGRLFIDVTERLAAPASRAALLEVMGKGDPLIKDALEGVLANGDFVTPTLEEPQSAIPGGGAATSIENDPAIVSELIEQRRQSLGMLRGDIRSKRGVELVDFILEDFGELRRMLFDPTSSQAVMAGIEATWWLNDKLEEWLGEQQAADSLTLSAPNNVTSEMGLALLDVADAIRPHPEVVAFLESAERGDVFADLVQVPGGRDAVGAIQAYLNNYGMRCVGEIDITRTRWSEQPAALFPAILANVRTFEPGEAQRRFVQGQQLAQENERAILDRLRALPGGEQKATDTKRMIDRVRTFIGFREYPKYHMVSRYFEYKQALLDEAERLVEADILNEIEDMYFLSLPELHDVVRKQSVDHDLIAERRNSYNTWHSLRAPRVITSEGEAFTGSYKPGDRPEGSLVGMPVSTGTVEGRARVVLDMADASLEPGDILVTEGTDPSWSPIFPLATALVTEVGGLMTHGAVIAREYGLPAVVGVENATQLITDGQHIRVHGTEGYVEFLS
jgi:pyruvate,water dikinase